MYVWNTTVAPKYLDRNGPTSWDLFNVIFEDIDYEAFEREDGLASGVDPLRNRVGEKP